MITWRAVRARAGQSLALFATGVAVVAGCVVAAGYSRATAGSVTAAGPLLLLGVVALAAQGAASARTRRYEIALAQLRGRYGARLLRTAVTEPLAVLAVATAVGTGLGWLGARAAVRAWAESSGAFALTSAEVAVAVGAFAVSAVVVVVVTWSTTYEPLVAKLSTVDRPRAASGTALFLSLLVLLGAVVSVYQARQVGVASAGWVSFVSPALLGLAAGQLGVWLVALVARLALGSAAVNRRIGWFLTLRRLTRISDSGSVIRITVAAVTVAGVAGSAWVGADAWRTSSARMETGGPVTFVVPGGSLQAYAAAHAADPDGEWLMALSAAPDPSGGSYRDVFVEVPRWDRVVGSFYAETPLREVTDRLGALPAQPAPELATGTTATVTLTASSTRRSLLTKREIRRYIKVAGGGYGLATLAFDIRYVDSDGDTQTLELPPPRFGLRPEPIRPGLVGYTVPIRVPGSRAPACDRACTVTGVDVQGRTTDGPVRITGLSFGELELLPLSDDGLVLAHNRSVQATASAAGIDVELRDAYSKHPLLQWPSHGAAPALVTPGLDLDRAHGKPLAYGIDGNGRPVDVVGKVAALPLLGRAGALLDLGTALRGAGGQIPETTSLVVARADTPPGVLAALQDTGAIGKRHVVAEALTRIRHGGTAQGTLLYSLIAAFGLLIALLSVVSAVADQRQQRRREAASLRVVGVDSGEVSRSYRGEAQALGLAVAVVAGIAVELACLALLGVLPLVDAGEFGLTFDAAPRLRLVVAVAITGGLVVALVVFLGFRLVGRSSPPRLLREHA